MLIELIQSDLPVGTNLLPLTGHYADLILPKDMVMTELVISASVPVG
jgi:hypothetical protein